MGNGESAIALSSGGPAASEPARVAGTTVSGSAAGAPVAGGRSVRPRSPQAARGELASPGEARASAPARGSRRRRQRHRDAPAASRPRPRGERLPPPRAPRPGHPSSGPRRAPAHGPVAETPSRRAPAGPPARRARPSARGPPSGRSPRRLQEPGPDLVRLRPGEGRAVTLRRPGRARRLERLEGGAERRRRGALVEAPDDVGGGEPPLQIALRRERLVGVSPQRGCSPLREERLHQGAPLRLAEVHRRAERLCSGDPGRSSAA